MGEPFYPAEHQHADTAPTWPEGVERGTVRMPGTKLAYRDQHGRVYALDPFDGTFHLCSPKLDAPSFRPDSAE